MRFQKSPFRNHSVNLEKPILNPDQHEYENPMTGDSTTNEIFVIDERSVNSAIV